jgi:hypothetical protein
MGLEKVGFTEGYDFDLKKWFNAASIFVKIILQRCSFYPNINGLSVFFLESRHKKCRILGGIRHLSPANSLLWAFGVGV